MLKTKPCRDARRPGMAEGVSVSHPCAVRRLEPRRRRGRPAGHRRRRAGRPRRRRSFQPRPPATCGPRALAATRTSAARRTRARQLAARRLKEDPGVGGHLAGLQEGVGIGQFDLGRDVVAQRGLRQLAIRTIDELDEAVGLLRISAPVEPAMMARPTEPDQPLMLQPSAKERISPLLPTGKGRTSHSKSSCSRKPVVAQRPFQFMPTRPVLKRSQTLIPSSTPGGGVMRWT